MSVANLDQAIAALPKRIEPEHVASLGSALGDRLGEKERTRLRRLLQDEFQRCSGKGLVALEALAGQAAPTRTPVAFKVGPSYTTELPEQSALCFISARHGFVVVDDESSTLWALPLPKAERPVNSIRLRKDDGSLAGLECVTFDRAAGVLLTASEDTGKVHEVPIALDGPVPTLGRPRLLGRLPELAQSANKGWEGLAVAPLDLTPDRQARLVAVQEGDPPLVCVFDRQTLALEAKLELPPEMAAVLPDLSDLTFDPKTGHLFLLSDEGCAIYEAALLAQSRAFGGRLTTDWSLVPIQATQLPELHGKIPRQAEGLAFDHHGDLWILGEGKTSLLHLLRE